MFEFTPKAWSEVKAYDTLTVNTGSRTIYFELTSGHVTGGMMRGRYVTKDGALHRGRRQHHDAYLSVNLADVVSVQRRDFRIYDVTVAEAQAWQELADNARAAALQEDGDRNARNFDRIQKVYSQTRTGEFGRVYDIEQAHAEALIEVGLRICDEMDAEEAAALDADGGWGQPEGMTAAATMPGFTRNMPCVATPGHMRGGSHKHDHLLATGPDCNRAWPTAAPVGTVKLVPMPGQSAESFAEAEAAYQQPTPYVPIRKGDTVVREGEPDGPRGIVKATQDTYSGGTWASVSFSGLAPIWVRVEGLRPAPVERVTAEVDMSDFSRPLPPRAAPDIQTPEAYLSIADEIATLRRELLNPGVVNGDLVRQVMVARLDRIAAWTAAGQ